MTPARARRAAVIAAAALLLAGCTTTVDGTGTRARGSAAGDFPSPSGSSGRSDSSSPTDSPTSSGTATGASADAKDLLDQMIQAMTTRSQGFTLKGDLAADDDDATLDLRMAGGNGSGSVTIGDERCDLVNVGGKGYARASAAFWTDDFDIDDDVAAEIDGRWVTMSGALTGLLIFVDAKTFFDAVADEDEYSLGDPTTKQGVDVQPVVGSEETFYISSNDPHLLLEMSDDDGPVDFGFPDDAFSVSAPAGAIPYPG